MDEKAQSTERKFFTLSEVAKSIESVIRKSFTGRYWVKAEIAKLNFYPKSGHCYPDLVEKKDGKALAQIRATIWASYFDAIRRNFKEATKEELREGMTVLFFAKVEFHATHGLQLNITAIDAEYSLGQMAREKIQTIQRLKQEGIFEANKKLPFPLLPKRIAIISVQTSKGFHDLMSILERNEWGYRFESILFPALLQGDHAVQSIRSQLWNISRYAKYFDVALIIRGGGGDIGLSCYDNYELAKDVALLPIPVITGIGHSTNETVAEMVAHQNKITPTDVAYFLLRQFHNFSARIDDAQETIIAYAENILSTEKERLEKTSRHFKINTGRLIEKKEYELRTLGENLHRSAASFISNRRGNLREISGSLRFKPLQKLGEEQSRISNYHVMLKLHGKQFLKNASGKLATFEMKVKLLEPRNVLKRGYSITFHNGKAIKDISKLKTSDIITTELHHGKIKSRIESTSNGEG